MNHCSNGGTCVTGEGQRLICICPDGFDGDTCNATESGETGGGETGAANGADAAPPSGPCARNPCQNDGVCQVTASTRRGDVFGEYVCKCPPGFDGVHCQDSKFRSARGYSS